MLDGDITITGPLRLDGTLILTAAPGASVVLENVTVKNAGWNFSPITDAEVFFGFKFAMQTPVDCLSYARLYDSHPVICVYNHDFCPLSLLGDAGSKIPDSRIHTS